MPLASASDTVVASVAKLFGTLDSHPTPGVRGTTLSKVLHRKRPELIPLHDRFVNAAYVRSRVVEDRDRSWEHYFTLLMHAMRDDLADSRWGSLVPEQSVGSPILTPLRALDIVVWTLGKKASGTRDHADA